LTVIETTPAARKPGSTLRRRRKLFTSRPAPASSINASAVSPVTSSRWKLRLPRPALLARAASFSAAAPRPATATSAGERPEDDGGHEGDAEGEDEHHGIEPEAHQVLRRLRHEPHQQRHARGRERRAEAAAGEPEHEALGQHQAHDPAAARPERAPQRELPLPRRPARQQQARHVGARDHQHEGDRAEHHQKRAPRLAHQVLPQVAHDGARASVSIGIGLGDPRHDHADVGLGLPVAHAGLEARVAVEVVRAPVLRRILEVPGALRHRETRRNPELRVVREAEPRRRHADHGIGLVVEQQRAPDHVGPRAEPRAPQRVADDHDVVAARSLLVRAEAAAEPRPDAHHLEEVGRDDHALAPLRLLALPQVEVDAAHGRHAGEDAVLRAQVDEVGRRHAADRASPLGPDDHQALVVEERQRTQQHGVDHVEDRDVRADAERKREDGDRAEAGVAAQHAQREGGVLPELLEPDPAPAVARHLPHQQRVAELAARCGLCLGFALAALAPLAHRLREVSLDLLAQLFVAPAAEERQPAAHGSLRSGFSESTPPIAPVSCSHHERASSSWRLPFAVRR
jgi:hypothetical protein